MSRLREELKIIPQTAWVIAAVLIVAVTFGFFFFQMAVGGPGEFPLALTGGMFVMYAFILATFTVYCLLLGYVAGDARRRGMRAILWVLLAMFMPSAIGFILYFILREPLLRPCPKCGTGARASFPFCPSCGETLAAVCPSCKNAVESGWTHCARCGAQLVVA